MPHCNKRNAKNERSEERNPSRICKRFCCNTAAAMYYILAAFFYILFGIIIVVAISIHCTQSFIVIVIVLVYVMCAHICYSTHFAFHWHLMTSYYKLQAILFILCCCYCCRCCYFYCCCFCFCVCVFVYVNCENYIDIYHFLVLNVRPLLLSFEKSKIILFFSFVFCFNLFLRM